MAGLLPVDFEVKNYACSSCHSVISYDVTKPGGAVVDKYEYSPFMDGGLSVGDSGNLYGVDYVVTGLLVKRVAGTFYWREYVLTGTNGLKVFLSETDGHWIFLTEDKAKIDVSDVPKTVTYEGVTFSLYGNEKTKLVYAEGFFDYELPTKSQKMTEYINPPFMLSFEVEKGSNVLFTGQHISASMVKRAFSAKKLPPKVGMGILQPGSITVRGTIMVFAITALLLIFCHVFIYKDKVQEQLLGETIPLSLYSKKEYVSKPFEIKGATGTLKINLQADVDNSWAYIDVGLVNELTGAEEYAGKDIEYYHGYEGGESWSEGRNSANMYLCGVAPGKYHLTLTPQKDVQDGKTTVVNVDVSWNPPSKRNVIIPIIILGILALIFYWIARNREMKRWADSDYSPFDS